MFIRLVLAAVGLATGVHAAGPAQPPRRGPRIRDVTPASRTVPRRGVFELRVTLDATYDNPYDPDQVDLRAAITGPGGGQWTVPGFFAVDYRGGPDTRPEPTGARGWFLRFSPDRPGLFRCIVSVTDRTGTATAAPVTFTCTPSDDPGFVRVSPEQPEHFQFESGAPYVPIGINLFVISRLGAPPPPDRLARCIGWIDRLADNGGNFARLRMDSWWLAIEGPADPKSGFAGPGRYNQETAWIIDRIYEKARRRGVRIMHCMDNANANVNAPRQPWRERYNFYLRKYGGTCDRPEDFWENKGAERNFLNRLRYAVARWGADTSVMSWEFWNEVVCRPDNIDRVAAWHARMARRLLALDPYRHPITTSVAVHSVESAAPIWKLPNLAINQTHLYNAPDLAAAFAERLEAIRGRYGKPFFFGEFGPSARDGRMVYDPEGVGLHNGLWAPMFAGAAGPAAFWYIESFMAPRGQFTQFRPLAAFVKFIPWNDPALRPLEAATPRFRTLPPKLHYVDFTLPVGRRFLFEKPPVTTFDIPETGKIANAEMLRPYLHCGKARKAPPVFRLHMRTPGRFIVQVRESVGDESNMLRVYVDGKLTIERPFPAGRKHHPKSTFIAAYENWKTPYDVSVDVPVPAGVHEVRPEAVGKDRLEVRYRLPGYLCFEKSAPLRLWGFTGPGGAWAWVQNRLSTAGRLQQKSETPTVPAGMVAELRGLTDGPCRIEWWDTWKGGRFLERKGTVRNGRLELEFPEIARDAACRIRTGLAR